VSAGLDGSKVDRNGRQSGRPPPKGFVEMTPLRVINSTHKMYHKGDMKTAIKRN